MGGESLDSSTGSRGQHQLALPSSSSSGQQAKALMNEACVENVGRSFQITFPYFFFGMCGVWKMFPVYRPTWPLFAQAEIPQKRRTAEPGTAAWQVGISQAFAGQVRSYRVLA